MQARADAYNTPLGPGVTFPAREETSPAILRSEETGQRRSNMRSRIIRAASRSTKKAPDSSFTGVVWQDEVFAPEAPSRMRASKVTFTPGARTNWHTHAVGQVLHVLAGVGRYQMEGDAVQVLLP